MAYPKYPDANYAMEAQLKQAAQQQYADAGNAAQAGVPVTVANLHDAIIATLSQQRSCIMRIENLVHGPVPEPDTTQPTAGGLMGGLSMALEYLQFSTARLESLASRLGAN